MKGRPAGLFVATRSFVVGGTVIRAGDTIAAGHPFLEGRESFVRPFTPTFGVPPAPEAARPGAENALARPGERRGGPPGGGG